MWDNTFIYLQMHINSVKNYYSALSWISTSKLCVKWVVIQCEGLKKYTSKCSRPERNYHTGICSHRITFLGNPTDSKWNPSLESLDEVEHHPKGIFELEF